MKQLPLPMGENDCDSKQLPFPTMAFGDLGQHTHKLFWGRHQSRFARRRDHLVAPSTLRGLTSTSTAR